MLWIDLARIAAILAVVTIHVATPLVANPSRPFDWWTGNVLDSMTRWSVPLFVMLSGALLLELRPRPGVADFYRRRLARLGVPFVTWIVIYLALGYLSGGTPKGLGDAFRALARGSVDVHLYFLFIIVGLYAVAPFLTPLVRAPHPRALPIAIAGTLAIGALSSVMDMFFGIGEPTAFTRWLPFLGYFLAGAWLVRSPVSPRAFRLAVVVAAAGMLATAVGTWSLVGLYGSDFGRGRYLYDYLSVTTIPTTVAMFVVVRGLGERVATVSGGATRLRRGLQLLGEASFGVYLIHPIVLRALGQVGLISHAIPALVWVVFTVAATSALSLVAVLAIRGVPGLRAAV